MTTCSWFSKQLGYLEWDTPPLTTIVDTCCWWCLSCGCVCTYEPGYVCMCVRERETPSRVFFLSLLNTWMAAVSEMEVLMISVLEESRSALTGECRFYDSDLHKSEVTSARTLCWASYVCVWEFTALKACISACISALSAHFCSFCISVMARKMCSIFSHFLFISWQSVNNVWVSMEGVCISVMVNS